MAADGLILLTLRHGDNGIVALGQAFNARAQAPVEALPLDQRSRLSVEHQEGRLARVGLAVSDLDVPALHDGEGDVDH